MAIAFETDPTTTVAPAAEPAAGTAMLGLACRACGRPDDLRLGYVCSACLGPLEARYDLALVARTLDAATIASRRPGIWRYRDLLPVAPPARSLAVGSTPLVPAPRL